MNQDGKSINAAVEARQSWRGMGICLVGLLGVAWIFLGNLGAAPLWDRDEPRNAGCAAEMATRQDWVVPIFNDQLRHQKPVMLYWLIISAQSVLGQTEFAARFWSAILGLGTVALTYRLAAVWGRPSEGFWGAAVLSSTLMFGIAARAATPDSAFIFFMTAALYCFVVGSWEAGVQVSVFPRQLRYSCGFYICLGLAVLTKGLAGFLLPMMIVGMNGLLWGLAQRTKTGEQQTQQRSASAPQRREWELISRLWRGAAPWHFWRTLLQMRPFTGAMIVLAVAGPWYAWVGYRTDGDFLRKFFWEEHIGRATTSFENHSGGWWYYPLAILVGFFPWSVLTWPIISELYASGWRAAVAGRSQDALRFLCVWVAIQVGVFSLVSTKLPSYVTPCYPALALLTGWFLTRLAEQRLQTRILWTLGGWGTLILCGLATTIGLSWVGMSYLAEQAWLGVFAIPLVLGGIWGMVWTTRKPVLAVGGIALAALLFYGGLWNWGGPTVGQSRQDLRLWTSVPQLSPTTPWGAYRCLESSWVYYSGRPVIELALPSESLTTLTGKENLKPKFWKPWPRMKPADFIRRYPSAPIVTTEEFLTELQQQIPGHSLILGREPYFLKQQALVLVGAATPPSTADNSGASPPSQTLER